MPESRRCPGHPRNSRRAGVGRQVRAGPRVRTCLVSSAGLAIAVTRTEADNRRVLHVSLSQASGYTTAAVAGWFGFFLVAILNRNKMNLDPFFTRSRVHHLRLRILRHAARDK